MKHHTKDKGDLGIFKAQLDLHERGYIVLNTMTEHAPFDLAAYKDGKFYSIQVKYRKLKYGRFYVSFFNSWADKNGSHSVLADKNQIDIYCVYCPDTDKCYYFDPKKFDSHSVTFRVVEQKNNQKKNIRKADDYLVF